MAVTAETTLFRQEYEREMESWLRRRFRFLCAAYWTLELLQFLWHAIWVIIVFRHGWEQALPNLVFALATSAGLLVIGGYLFGRTERLDTRDELLTAASQMILLLGAISFTAEIVMRFASPGTRSTMIFSIAFWHLTASLFLPWRPRESIRPMIPLLIAWGLVVATFEISARNYTNAIIIPVLGWLVLIPGLAINAWRISRHSREFHKVMVGRAFSTIRKELAEARTIHESMFPERYDDGHVRFEYEYQPMREMGGDFVHFHVSPSGVVNMVIIDVTGHGLAAALTVNRLYGELERLRAEGPNMPPAEVIRLLNRYVQLTMAHHNIYATALAISLDPYDGTLRCANAGHPPAFLRAASGAVRELMATGVVLGALMDEEYEIEEISDKLNPGDSVVAYTDGAFETRNRRGEQFGLNTVRETFRRQPAPANWASFLTSLISRHAAGRSQDDVLIVALTYLNQRREQRLPEPLRAVIAK